MIPKEFYFSNNNNLGEATTRRTAGSSGRATREKKQDSRACPSNCGKLLQWNELDGVYECFLCGYRTMKQKVDPTTTESLGAVNIVTADGYYGGSDGLGGQSATSKPRIKAKWGSRSVDSIRRARGAAVVKGDHAIEKWLNEPAQANTYLKAYDDSSQE